MSLKAGNACILRGGKEAINSNRILTRLIQEAISRTGLSKDVVQFVDSTDRLLVDELLAEKPMGDLDDGVNDVILRLSRPFATKLVSFIALPLTATAIAGGIALPFVGLAGGAFAGVLAGGAVGALIIGFSASTAVDWLLTRADEAISRENFEGNLRRAVNLAATRFEERVSVALQKHVTAQYAQVTSTILGHKP